MFPSRGFLVKSILLAGLCAAVVGCPQPRNQQLALQVTPSSLEFGTTDAPQTFVVRLNMDTTQALTITSTVDPGATWLSVDPVTGTLSAPNEPVTVTVHVDRGKLKKGTNAANITVGSAGLVSRTVTVTASTPMAADFVGDPKSIWKGETVSFEDRSEVATGEAAITSWDWNFGDGSPHSASKNVTHTYTTAGKKTVVLTVGSSVRQDVETKVDYIEVVQTAPPSAAFTADPLSVMAGSPIQFTDASVAGTAAIESWSWDFGDGQHSTDKNPVHTYANGGYYTVSLTVTSPHGADTETRTNFLFVLQETPQARFTFPDGMLLANTAIPFTDTSIPGTGTIISWAWNFGDGSQATTQHPSHSYSTGGNYTVTLTVGTVHGTSTVSHPLTVTQQAPTANFNANPPSPPVNTVVQFSDISLPGTSPITTWLWDFGDNSPSSPVKNPSHKYTQAGTYQVTLSVTSLHGTDSVTIPLVVRIVPPTANFTATPFRTYEGHDFVFTDTSVPGTSPITSWAWDFGDGATSTQKDTTHRYAHAGRYTVSLTVTSAHGSNTAVKFEVVTVLPAEPPIANFTMSDATPYEADEVIFTDTSQAGSAPIATWLWDFGDGVTSVERNPRHVYGQPGDYLVSLTVTSPDGTDSETKPITVAANTDPVANFSATPLTPIAGTAVKFKDLSTKGTAPIISWLWNFGDPATSAADNESSEQNPSHVYSEPGMYTVSLEVVTLHGTDSISKAQYIQVRPRVDFTATPTSAAVGKRVQFADLTSPGASTVASRLWDFGDGTTGTEEKPVHLYGREGTFTVSLTVTLANGATGSLTKQNYITVSIAGPTASFTVSNLRPLMFESVSFSDTSDPGSGNIIRWAWNFGDGTTSSAKSPFHTYDTEGTYTVTLTVTNSFDPEVDGTPAWATSAATKTLTVGGPTPVVQFTQDKSVVLREIDAVTFTSEASIEGAGQIFEYQWYVWQGDAGAQPSIDEIRSFDTVYTTSPILSLHEYPFHDVGYYNVSLTVLSSTMTDPGNPRDPNNLAHFKATTVTKANAIEVREPSELDKFVHTPEIDPEFAYSLRQTVSGQGYKTFFVDMTSQRWNGGSTEGTPAALWKHFMTIVQPDNLLNETALLYLDGGTNTDVAPTTVNAKLAQFAIDSGSVVIVVTGIPNQPLLFPQKENPLSEDDLIAASMDQFLSERLDQRDPNDLVLFPMVKAAVRAMDAAQGFLADPRASGNIPPLELDGFVVSGGSTEGWSRGWATWLTAAADPRVKAIMPMSFDALNLFAQFPRQWNALGFYSEALAPYVQAPPLGFDIYHRLLDNPTPRLVVSDALRLREGWRRLQEIQLQMLYNIRDNTYIVNPNLGNDLSQLAPLKTVLDSNVLPSTQALYSTYVLTQIAVANSVALTLSDKVAGLLGTPPADAVETVHDLAGFEEDLYKGDIGNCIATLQTAEQTLLREYPGNWSVALLDPIFYSDPYVQTLSFYSEFGGRLNVPKYIMNSTGDVFTTPDSSGPYFGYLAGEKALRYFPNTEHDLGGLPEAVYSALPWYRQVVDGVPRPEFTWTFLSDQQLVVRPQGAVTPSEVKLWVAQAADRDFRRDATLNPNSPEWIASTLTADAEGKYYIQMRPTLDTYTAYFAELTYATTDGKALVYTTDVRVLAPYSPTADFTVSDQTPEANEPVQFFDRSRPGVAPITKFIWDFGDGTTSTEQFPVHAYATGGTYTVSLRITTAYGTDEERKVGYIVATQVKPIAEFVANDLDAEIGQAIQFTDQSIPGQAAITSWLWDFGDGTTSTQRNPSHTYLSADSYAVSLTVTTSLGANTLIKQDYILVTQVRPVAKFTTDRVSVPLLVPVEFTDQSISGAFPITHRLWEFGDGATSTLIDPTHAYSAMGVYTVRLTVTNAAGSHTVTKTNLITVTPDITASPMKPAVAQAVHFSAVVGAASVKAYAWQFGDGFTSAVAVPVHQYGRAGVFDVTLRITLQDDTVWTIVKPAFMEVGSAAPVASFTASDYNPMPNELVTFTDTSRPGSAAITRWAWTFGDGASSASQSPYHSYASPGAYTVTLTVETLFGTDTVSGQIVVAGVAPTASFTIDKKIAYRQVDDITFTSTSTVAGDAKFLAFYWSAWKTDDTQIPHGSIGQGQVCVSRPSEETRLSFPFHEAGTYSVTLTVFASMLENPGDPFDPGNAGNFVTSSLTKENVLEIREPTALDRFIHSDTTSYKSASLQSRFLGTSDGVGYTCYVINLVAHSWETYTTAQPTPKDWTHWLTIVQPDNLNNNTALMYLEGGNRNDAAPTSADPVLAKFAVHSGSVVSVLTGMPNQPLEYVAQGGIMSGDRLNAATMDAFLDSTASASDVASMNLLFPMVKSVVHGMDAVQNFLGDPSASGNVPPLNIENFVLAGGSETGLTRGWVTWIAPTTDERVRGIIPIGFDFLNLDAQLPYQLDSLGMYSEVLVDYTQLPPAGFDVFSRLVATHATDDMADPIGVRRYYRFLERYQRLMLHDGWYQNMTWLEELNALLHNLQNDLSGMFPTSAGAPITLASQLHAYTHFLLDTPPPKDPASGWHYILVGLAGDPNSLYGGDMGELEDALVVLEEKFYTENRGPYESFLVDPLYYAYPFTQALNWYSPYGGRLNMPKYIVNSTGDQFSMPDAAQFYMGHLAGTNHLRYYPNTNHTIEGYHEAVYDALPWYDSLVNADILPKFTWEYNGDGFISLSFPDENLPSSITLWVAVSPDGSDFRFDGNLQDDPPGWFSSDVPVVPDGQGHITLQVFPSITETSAYYIELTYPSADGGTFTTSTPVRIVPPYDSPFKSARPSMEPSPEVDVEGSQAE